MTELQKKRQERRKETAEDFTPLELVNEMLSKLPQEVWINPSKTFCDPAAGNGNFLIEVLRRKLDNGHDPLQALNTIYGVELMKDNVKEMRDRLLELIPIELHEKAKRILYIKIVCHDALTWDFDKWESAIRKSKELF